MVASRAYWGNAVSGEIMSDTESSGIRQKVLAASAGRDRVADAVKALALALVVVAHNLAWTVNPDGSVTNTLEAAPNLFPLTWVLQILPLFFLLAGSGLRRHAGAVTTMSVVKRIDRLVTPAVLLLLVTAVLSALLSQVAGSTIGQYAGLLPMQLTWFLGVYLMVVAVSSLLAKMTRWWHFALMLVVIAIVDALRVAISEQIGWVNLLLVWAYFAALGLQLPKLRELPRSILAVGALGSAGLAVAAVVFGPYSAALVTTAACPGLSNLAPPTIVLALAGTAQICVLLLLRPMLERMLRSDRRWIPVAVFSSRAMGIYLWHMLILSLCVGVAISFTLAPPPLGPGWWGLHLVVFTIVITVVWLISPTLLRLSDSVITALSSLVPDGVSNAIRSLPPTVVAWAAAIVGVVMALASESGLSDLLTPRLVIGLPYVPAAALLIVVSAAALSRAAQIPEH